MAVQDEAVRLEARFLAALGDELRAPLRAIIGFAELLAGGMAPDSRRQADYSGQILTSARQLLHQINSLVELARADAGELRLVRQPADLSRLVTDAIRLVQPAADGRGVEISADLADAPARVVLDAPRIMHALHGMLTGAIDLAGEGKVITLRVVTEDDRSVRLEVGGLGIGPGHTGEFIAPTPGAWLGLALARSIVNAHGGRVGVASPGGRRVLYAVLPGAMLRDE